ncbi:hypothetical protein RUND412_001536 [Rhizina undulata]
MKSAFSIAALVAAVAVSAQTLADYPSCALTCLTEGLAASGCSITDFACACASTSFVDGSATCIQGACDAADQLTARDVSDALCKSAGVTLATTFAVSSSAAAAVVSSAAATVAATTEAIAPTTAVAVSTSAVEVSATAAATTAIAATTEAASSVPAVVTVPTTLSSSVAVHTNATKASNSSYTSPAVATSTGGSGKVTAGFGLMIAGFMAAFAL